VRGEATHRSVDELFGERQSHSAIRPELPSMIEQQPGADGPVPRFGGERRPVTDAEARALASAVRLRIRRLCLHEALTNKEIAARLGRNPASVLHHVRTLVEAGFLAPGAERRGARGAREVPYRATGEELADGRRRRTGAAPRHRPPPSSTRSWRSGRTGWRAVGWGSG
jgi:hypothetical protein